MADTSPTVIARIRIEPARLDEIERRLLRAEAAADFVPELAKEWGRSKRRVWDYVARVRKRLAERARASKLDPDADAELVRALALETYRVAREGTDKGPDTRGMAAAVKLLGEMTGAIGPRRLELSGPGGGPIQTHAAVVVLPAIEPADGALAAQLGTPDPSAPEPRD